MELTWRDYGFALFFWVGVLVITFFGSDVEKEYEERGIDVVATITQINEMPRKGEMYVCTYYNEAGELIEARLTLNRFDASIGQQVGGKYLPETPEHVYCKANMWIKVFVLAVFCIGAIIYTLKIYMCKKYGDIMKQL